MYSLKVPVGINDYVYSVLKRNTDNFYWLGNAHDFSYLYLFTTSDLDSFQLLFFDNGKLDELKVIDGFCEINRWIMTGYIMMSNFFEITV